MSLGMGFDPTDLGLQGTTATAYHFDKAVMLGVESRASNEKDPKKKLKILDDVRKLYAISDNVVAIMLGSRKDSLEMQKHMIRECAHMESVSNVFKTAEEYVTGFRGWNKYFGTILCGSDAKGPRIFSVYVKGEDVGSTTDPPFVSLGSGSGHAKEIAGKIMGSLDGANYNYNLSSDVYVDITLRCLFDATFHDKFSGGPLHVYQVCDGKCQHVRTCDVLDAYSRYYDLYKEENILFLIFDCIKGQHLRADDLLSYFRPYGNITLAHRVAHIRVAKNTGFYFHRLVCSTPKDASGIYDYVKKAVSYHLDSAVVSEICSGSYHLDATPASAVVSGIHSDAGSHLDATPPSAVVSEILSAFPHSVTIEPGQSSIQLYVNRASSGLLKLLRRSCIYRAEN